MEREHMLNSMLRSISHDLRTPLTGIVGASQFMMNQDRLTNEDVYSLAKDIHDQHIG
ncbi:MAG: histidine kinase dimerization/phospho-acceptor domain-containing protein [Faecalibacillus faecis]